MRKLFFYIFSQLSSATVIVVSILIATLWIIESMKFFEMSLQSQESFNTLFSLMLFLLPDLFVIITPLAAFISTLFVYNKLQSDRELNVLYSAGFSPWEIAKPAATFAFLLAVIIYIINISVLPWSFQKMRDFEYDLKKALPGILLQEGVFNTFNDITIYVHQKEGNDLKGILAYLQKKGESPSTFMAKEGRLVMVNQAPQIIMVEGSRQEFNPHTNSLSILYFDQTVLTLFEKQLEQTERPKKPYELSLREIFLTSDIKDNENHHRLYAEGLQRLLVPWYSLAFVLIALVFILRTSFNRNTNNTPIIQSIGCVLFIQTSCIFVINLSSRQWYFIGAAYALVLASIIVCIWILKKEIHR